MSEKNPETLPNETSIKLLTFNNYNAYLIVNKTHKRNVPLYSETPENKVKAIVQYAIARGMSKEALLSMITSSYNNQGE